MKKFCVDEMHVLRETFKGLANAKNGSTVDKETFLKCFPLPGLLGGRGSLLNPEFKLRTDDQMIGSCRALVRGD